MRGCIALLVGLSLWAAARAAAQAQPGRAVVSTTRQQETSIAQSSALLSLAAKHAESEAPSAQLRFPQGRYLFGQSPEPEQIGSVYVIFEVAPDRIVGAFYMPRSSFDCFQGRTEGDRLILTIRNSYEPATFTHSIALVERQNVVASGGSAALEAGLEGFNAIDSISENDARILSICQSETW